MNKSGDGTASSCGFDYQKLQTIKHILKNIKKNVIIKNEDIEDFSITYQNYDDSKKCNIVDRKEIYQVKYEKTAIDLTKNSKIINVIKRSYFDYDRNGIKKIIIVSGQKTNKKNITFDNCFKKIYKLWQENMNNNPDFIRQYIMLILLDDFINVPNKIGRKPKNKKIDVNTQKIEDIRKKCEDKISKLYDIHKKYVRYNNPKCKKLLSVSEHMNKYKDLVDKHFLDIANKLKNYHDKLNDVSKLIIYFVKNKEKINDFLKIFTFVIGETYDKLTNTILEYINSIFEEEREYNDEYGAKSTFNIKILSCFLYNHVDNQMKCNHSIIPDIVVDIIKEMNRGDYFEFNTQINSIIKVMKNEKTTFCADSIVSHIHNLLEYILNKKANIDIMFFIKKLYDLVNKTSLPDNKLKFRYMLCGVIEKLSSYLFNTKYELKPEQKRSMRRHINSIHDEKIVCIFDRLNKTIFINDLIARVKMIIKNK